MRYIGLPLWVRQQHIRIHSQPAASDGIGPLTSRQTCYIDKSLLQLRNSGALRILPTLQETQSVEGMCFEALGLSQMPYRRREQWLSSN